MLKEILNNKLAGKYFTIILFYSVIDKLYGTIYVGHMSKSGVDEASIGFILAISSIALSLFDYPTGSLADKYGRKKIMLTGFSIWGISLFLYAFSSNITQFILVLILWSLAVSLISGSPDSWFVDEAFRIKNEELLGIMPKVSSISLISGAAVSVMVTFMIKYLGDRSPFLIAAVLSFLLVFIMAFRMHENYGDREISLKRAVVKNTLEMIKDPLLSMNLLRAMIGRIPFLVFVMTWQLYLLNHLKMAMSNLGYTLAFFIFILALGNYLAAYLMKKAEGAVVSIIGHGFIIFGSIVLIFASNLLVFAIGAGLIELGLGLDSGAVMVWVQKIVPSESRTALISGMYAVGSLSGFIIPFISGLIIKNLGYQMIWVFCISGSLLTILILVKMNRMIRKSICVDELLVHDAKKK
ncbi:MFS transporter [Heyndrickxia faecalis]|uniref:MFS transporter n=2 Tax=Bacillaceae TaxID=186817 RepID=UPI000689EDCF|nr:MULTISPECIES: MFS transporter [Heyndrickxia]MED4322073.1 MFS transporter [Weizmannia sp. CD-2023]MED4867330.1 MFS transporter [Weizmannia sp. CD-2023]NMH82846.1 MFS transporter [Heyndrickxia coagulans]NWN95312.1 MFS transporter [Bacillus sp. (in: firmicutes)]